MRCLNGLKKQSRRWMAKSSLCYLGCVYTDSRWITAKASAAASKRGDARRLQLLQTRRERAERELEEVEAETRKMASLHSLALE
ncbi:hypothetical protein RSOL_165870 [Rhizoctonia solani AG-3 Rhs1AP]|uniref:Uncharacterized protein n=2 Tax=Rhizoctonia solani AG-3 TaxID=1086053 RepID=A0A074S7Z7_9AGAM|nr:hypothetical protein RSOL_165870 [Rhizoctonia solani AG-3 Rhs1AP]KEP53715.1 hypothetical protein V565_027380 [Rhizoctonia solani 123E]